MMATLNDTTCCAAAEVARPALTVTDASDDRRPGFASMLGSVAVRVSANCIRILVEYRGLPTDLLAIGAIEPGMLEKGRKGHAQLDSNGDRYRRKLYRSGKLEISRSVKSFDRARQLPGVPHDIADELISWLDAHPNEMHISRKPTTCGQWVWVSYSGSLPVLLAAGVITGENDYRLREALVNGYHQVSECVPIEPFDREDIEQKCPGVKCTRVYRNPRHHSGHQSFCINLEGSKADFLRHGLIPEAMTKGLMPLPGNLNFTHASFRSDSRSISVRRWEGLFQVQISDAGESIKAVQDLLEGNTKRRWVKLRVTPAVIEEEELSMKPDLRLVVDNTHPKVSDG